MAAAAAAAAAGYHSGGAQCGSTESPVIKNSHQAEHAQVLHTDESVASCTRTAPVTRWSVDGSILRCVRCVSKSLH